MPARDGAGWLLRICPDADVILIVLETLMVVYCIYLILKPREYRMHDEESDLLWFVYFMLVTPVSFLIGVSAWFATQSIPVGLGAATGFSLFCIVWMRQR
jgi:hypothetical protein